MMLVMLHIIRSLIEATRLSSSPSPHRRPWVRAGLLALCLGLSLHPGLGSSDLLAQSERRLGGGAPDLSPPLRLVRAFDGDSAVLRLASGEVVKVRMVAIDAPEKAQPHAAAARKRFESLLNAEGLRGRPLKKDGFGRWIVTLEVKGQDVGQTLIREGHAWYYRRYRSDLPAALRPAYEEAQAVAREERRGLWVEPDPLPPWQYRSKQRRREQSN